MQLKYYEFKIPYSDLEILINYASSVHTLIRINKPQLKFVWFSEFLNSYIGLYSILYLKQILDLVIELELWMRPPLNGLPKYTYIYNHNNRGPFHKINTHSLYLSLTHTHSLELWTHRHHAHTRANTWKSFAPMNILKLARNVFKLW